MQEERGNSRTAVETPEQELRALRKRRFAILSELHQQQQDLDQIDYRIHQMRDGKKSGEE